VYHKKQVLFRLTNKNQAAFTAAQFPGIPNKRFMSYWEYFNTLQ